MSIRRRRIIQFSIVMVLIVFITSCYKEQGPEYYDDLDITITYYDNTVDFSTYNTFTVRDSVGLFSDYFDDQDIKDFYAANGLSQKIIIRIKEKFQALGYTYVDNKDDADFAINPFAAFFEVTGGYGYPIWWWDPYYFSYYSYYYPYYPGWGGGYYPGWYPWGYDFYSYNTGSLMMEMVDGESLRNYRDWMGSHTHEEIENSDPNSIPKLEFIWQALINGVLSDDAKYNQNRLNSLMDEAFKQSPYLGK